MTRAKAARVRGVPYPLALLVVGLVIAGLLGGCGGGSATESVQASPENAAVSGGDSSESIVASKDPVSKDNGVTDIATATYPTGLDNDEISPSGAKPVEPCNLVSKAKAVQILGGGVQVSEKPQGPTCVYAASGREVALVVEEASLGAIRKGARHASPVTIGARTGWCLRYESSSVVVSVQGGRVLQVAGPCPAAVRFAATALPRITG